jgi:hypothetical protein
LALCLATIGAGAGFASELPPPTLNPTTYVSPSGVYSLAVDPTDRYGRGPADYRLTKDGKTVWARRLPYTFWQASVADSGRAAGYAYTHGWRGFSEAGGDAGPGEFIVAVLSAEGKPLGEEKHARQRSRFLHSAPDPRATGVFVNAPSRRFVVRVADPDLNRRIEQWWVFDLENGRRTGTLEPARSMPQENGSETRLILHALSVPGTPLVLLQWWKYASGECGGVFTLVDLGDPKLKPLWTLTLNGDYSVPGDKKKEDDIRRRIWREGAIWVNKSPGVFRGKSTPYDFSIESMKRQEQILFSVANADGSWRVHEMSRRPW